MFKKFYLNPRGQVNIDAFRKLVLVFISLVSVITISYLSPNFREIYFINKFIQDISILLILSCGLSLVFLSGAVDLSLGGIYIIALASMRLWRESRFDAETNYFTELGVAFLLCIGVGLLGAFIGWLVAKRPAYSTLISLSFAILFGAVGAYFIPQTGPWCDPWFCVDITISETVLFYIVVAAALLLSVKVIRHSWPEFDWIRWVFLIWLASVLALFVVYSQEGLTLVALIAFSVFAFLYFLIHQSIYGRSILAVGDNREAARLCGVSVVKVSILVFGLMAFFSAIASLFEVRSISSENIWLAYERQLDALVAVLIAGVSFRGGIGNLSGILTGVLAVSAINLFPEYLNLPMVWTLSLKAILLLCVIVVDPGRMKAFSN